MLLLERHAAGGGGGQLLDLVVEGRDLLVVAPLVDPRLPVAVPDVLPAALAFGRGASLGLALDARALLGLRLGVRALLGLVHVHGHVDHGSVPAHAGGRHEAPCASLETSRAIASR